MFYYKPANTANYGANQEEKLSQFQQRIRVHIQFKNLKIVLFFSF